MLPRHAYLSATMLALAATMSEEDFPVVPSPDDLDAPPEPDDAALGCEGPESHWSSVLGCAILDDMRADEAAQEGSHYDFNEGQGHGYDGRYDIPCATGTPDASMRFLLRSWARDRPEQRANKKARAKRKAKKGWA